MISPERMHIVEQQWLRLVSPWLEPVHAYAIFDDLVRRHSEPHRHYHTLEHVGEVLKVANRLAKHAADPVAVAIAAWFHDAVYDPTRADNEAASAELVFECPMRSDVVALIMATRHAEPPTTADTAVLLDADLAILAASEVRYDRYTADVRREYEHVSDDDFRVGRLKVLQSFLARERIYHTPTMFAEAETAARANLLRESAKLAG